MVSQETNLFTIGYTCFGNNANEMIQCLNKYRISVVIDVRSSPFSAYYTEFNKDYLEPALKQNSIYYRNYAVEFGARQTDRALYPNGYLDFSLFSKTEQFQTGIARIKESLRQGYRIVLMCAEKEPIHCHRSILIAHAFLENHIPVIHLLANEKMQTQESLEEELMAMYPIGFLDEPEDPLTFALRKQNEAIGYKLNET